MMLRQFLAAATATAIITMPIMSAGKEPPSAAPVGASAQLSIAPGDQVYSRSHLLDVCHIPWIDLFLVVVHRRDTQTAEGGTGALQIPPLAFDDLAHTALAVVLRHSTLASIQRDRRRSLA